MPAWRIIVAAVLVTLASLMSIWLGPLGAVVGMPLNLVALAFAQDDGAKRQGAAEGTKEK